MSCLNNAIGCTCNLLKYSKNVNLVFVRYRKPRWLPKAPSKIYKVRLPTPIDPVEAEKMNEWTRHYNSEMKGVRRYLINYNTEREKRKEKMRAIDEGVIPFHVVYQTMVEKNAAWNRKTAILREEDMSRKSEIQATREQKYAERDVREREEVRQGAVKDIINAEEWKENYVTEDNIDDIIEELLNSRVDYDFALSPDGSTTTDTTDTNESTNVDPGT